MCTHVLVRWVCRVEGLGRALWICHLRERILSTIMIKHEQGVLIAADYLHACSN